MVESGPKDLRRFADLLEDTRQMENVEICRRVPELDQRLLLSLNWRREGNSFAFPDAGTVTKWLQERIISVSSPDGQSVVLGIFYTNREPFNPWQRITVCIFPLYADIVDYLVRPYIGMKYWESHGQLTVVDGASAGNDPFLAPNLEGLDFIFFRKSPFSDEQPYKAILPDKTSWNMPTARLCDNTLERNVIERAMWYVSKRRKPRLFTMPGFRNFVGKNRFDPTYTKLYVASGLRLRYTSPAYNY